MVTPAAQASFGVSEAHFEAGTCNTTSCTYASRHSELYTQAAGHPPWGITTFELNTSEGPLKVKQPEGALKRIRVDVPPGLAADPEALTVKCSMSAFEHEECPTGTNGSEVGRTELTVFDGLTDLTVGGTVYELERPAGLPLTSASTWTRSKRSSTPFTCSWKGTWTGKATITSTSKSTTSPRKQN